MNRARRPPLEHPLAPLFDRAVDSFCVSLSLDTTRHYRGTIRNFLSYLSAVHPEVQHLEQLRRELHILGWISRLRSQTPPLATASCINRLIALRCIFNELAWTVQLPELAHLIRRNRLGGNVFLLIRHTGMRIGECADLSFDSFREPQLRVWHVDDIPVSYMMLSEMCAQTGLSGKLPQIIGLWFLVDDGLSGSNDPAQHLPT